MGGPTLRPQPAQITGNAALFFAAWQLSRRGWHVMPTIRNARGSDLIVASDDEAEVFGVRSKGLSRRAPVPLGRSLESLRSRWWIITIYARSEAPSCSILALAEVRALAYRDKTGEAFWLQPPAYDRPEFKDAWHRLTPPAPS